jgi:osmotically-inducible protein OsmY
VKNDTELQDDVMAELQWEPSVKASGIGVSAKDGVVTLTDLSAAEKKPLCASLLLRYSMYP